MVVIFILIPLAYFIPQYLDSGITVSKGEIKLITISENDYKKLIDNKNKTTVSPPSPNSSIITKDAPGPSFAKIVKNIIPPKVSLPTPQKKIIAKKIIKLKKLSTLKKIPLPVLKPLKPDLSVKKNIEKIQESSPVDDINNVIDDTVSEAENITPSVPLESLPEPDPINLISNDNPQTTIFGASEDIASEDIQISVKDIIAVQLNKCWNQYYNPDADINNLVVTAVIGYAMNGSVNKIDIENKIIIGDSKINIYNIMTQNAKKAIINCSPLKGLPADSYAEWKFVKINFMQGKNK